MIKNDQEDKKKLARIVKLSNRLLTDITDVSSGIHHKSETELSGTFFSQSYQQWYSESRQFVSRMIPARLPEFEFFYRIDKKRQIVTREMYSIRDWILDVKKAGNRAAAARVNKYSTVAMKRFCCQCRIIKSIELCFKRSSFGIDPAILDFDNATRDLHYEQDFLQFLNSAANVFIASKDLLFDGPEASRFRDILLERFEKDNIVIDI